MIAMPHQIEAGTYVTVAEAAEMAGCTGGYIRRLLQAEKLPGHRLTDRMWLVPVDAVSSLATELTSRSLGRRAKKASRKKPRRR